jgi:hypothetical protein
LTPAESFNDQAVAYFNGVVGSAPVQRVKFTAPDAVFSPACLATLDRVDAAGSAATKDDRQTQATCEAQALEAVHAGAAHSGRLVEYRWTRGDQRVTVSSSELPGMPASAADPVPLRAVESQVYIGLVGDMQPYRAEIARLQASLAQQSR